MSTNPEARAWVEIRADALRANVARIRAAVGAGVGVLPMVKADAYGLGLAEAVRVLDAEDPWGFGVATVDEGARLRALGVTRRIVVCSPTPPGELARAVGQDLQLSVSSLETLSRLAEIGRARSVRPAIHVDVDTGMGRSGFDWERHAEWLPKLIEAAHGPVEWVGCHTHLHSADESEASVREQWERFDEALSATPGLPEGLLVHVLNSAGALRVPELARALVRPGVFLYGGGVGEDQPAPEEVVSVRARVVHVRDASPGTTLGYGVTYRAEREESWATLAIGYADGLPRALGNRGSALLLGRRVPIIGRISMDVTVVDISDLRGVAAGDVATLLGSDGDERIDVDEVASEAGTISYEVLTGLGSRLPRVWKGA
jgi:alanine racemase